MKCIYLFGILLLYCLMLNASQQVCLVNDVYNEEKWLGEKLVFYTYLTENESVNITIHNTLYNFPSAKHSKLIEKKYDGIHNRTLKPMKYYEKWVECSISLENGKLHVLFERNTHEEIPINAINANTPTGLIIKASNLSLCENERSWEVSKEKPQTIPLGRDIDVIDKSFTLKIKTRDTIRPVLRINDKEKTLLENEYTLIVTKTEVIFSPLKNSTMKIPLPKSKNVTKIYMKSQSKNFTVSVGFESYANFLLEPTLEPYKKEDEGLSSKASSSSKTIWVITISVLLSLAGIGIIITILFKRWRGKPYTKKINAFEEGISLLPMEDQFREDERSLLAYVTVDKPSSISSSTINSLKNPGTDGSRSEGGVSGQLEQLFRTAVVKAYPEAEIPNVVMTKSEQADYQCNTPIGLAKKLKKNPHEVGQEIIENVPSNPLIEKLEVSGPGFINIMLSKDFIRKQITNIIMHGVTPPAVSTKHVVVDFLSPNVAQEIGVVNLRSAIIGDSICRLLEFLGHKVTRLSHLGDWGTPLGMLIAHLNDSFPGFATHPLAFEDLQRFYEDSKKRFNKDKAFKKQACEAVVKLQSGDPEHIKGWTEICNISRREHEKFCTAFDIKITDRGESFYQSRMESLVKELEAGGHLQHFDGRKIMFGEDVKSLLTVVKSDGGFTSDTTDLTCLKQRIVEEKADWVIYVVTNGESQYLKKVFCCGQKVGFYDPSKVRVDIVDFRWTIGEDGRKVETFVGDQIMALLNEGAERAEDKLKEYGRDMVLTPEEFRIARDAVAYGCIKYAELSHDRTMDYTFSFDQMLNFRGNTAAYLLYALKQIRSIGRTAEVSRGSLLEEASKGPVELVHEKEWNLARTLIKLPDVLLRITEDLHIHPLCDYMYEVSSVFTEFYSVCYCVEKDKEGNIIKVNMSRMILCEATAAVMEQCFTILGIKTVEKM